MNVSDWLISPICDGVVFGVGITVAFIPYLMMPCVFLAISEECGYMARVTFITDSAFISPLVYLLSIIFVILGGIFLKHTMFKGEPSPFVMELPEYRLPRLKNIKRRWPSSVRPARSSSRPPSSSGS